MNKQCFFIGVYHGIVSYSIFVNEDYVYKLLLLSDIKNTQFGFVLFLGFFVFFDSDFLTKHAAVRDITETFLLTYIL